MQAMCERARAAVGEIHDWFMTGLIHNKLYRNNNNSKNNNNYDYDSTLWLYESG